MLTRDYGMQSNFSQPSWQASVPVPIDITYDVPTALEFDEESTPLIDPGAATNQSETRLENSSFALPPERLIAQAVIPEQFSIRLHPPTVREDLHFPQSVT